MQLYILGLRTEGFHCITIMKHTPTIGVLNITTEQLSGRNRMQPYLCTVQSGYFQDLLVLQNGRQEQPTSYYLVTLVQCSSAPPHGTHELLLLYTDVRACIAICRKSMHTQVGKTLNYKLTLMHDGVVLHVSRHLCCMLPMFSSLQVKLVWLQTWPGPEKKAKYASISRTHLFFPSQLTPQGHLVRRPWLSLISVAIQ